MAVHGVWCSCFTCVLELMSHVVPGVWCSCFTCVLELMSHGSTWCLVLMFYLCFRVDVPWQYMVPGAHGLLVF